MMSLFSWCLSGAMVKHIPVQYTDVKRMLLRFILLIILLSGANVRAQPGNKVFGVEHDWLYHTGNTNSYGIYQYTNYGSRNTVMHLGKKSFTVPMRAEPILATILLVIMVGGGTIAWFMWPRGAPKPVRENPT